MGVAVGAIVSVGRAVGEEVASDRATSGAVVITQRLTTVTSARITIRVNPSNKYPMERCVLFVFLSSYYTRVRHIIPRTSGVTSDGSAGKVQPDEGAGQPGANRMGFRSELVCAWMWV